MNDKEYFWDYPADKLGLMVQHDEVLEDIARDQKANEIGLQCPPEDSCEKQGDMRSRIPISSWTFAEVPY